LSYIPDADELSWIGSLVALGALMGNYTTFYQLSTKKTVKQSASIYVCHWLSAHTSLNDFRTENYFSLPAPFVAGPLADMIGRKWTLLCSSMFYMLSWVLLILTCSVPQIYIARLLQGFGVGFVMTAQTMYIGEIASDDCRGALGSFMQLGIVIGILYVYVVGPYVSFVAYQWFCLAIPIVFVVTFYFMPDTPAFFISKGRRADAIKSLKYLRGKTTEGIQKELDMITASVEESMKNKASFSDIFNSKGNVKGKSKEIAVIRFLFSTLSFLQKALIISVGLLSFQQLSGINVVLFYSQSIFEKAGSSMEPAIATIAVGNLSSSVNQSCTDHFFTRYRASSRIWLHTLDRGPFGKKNHSFSVSRWNGNQFGSSGTFLLVRCPRF
jgi:MFS family permease